MAVEVTMPKFGLTMHEGTVQRFFKALGEEVRQGEPLYEVETEKVLYEVEAPASGVLAIAMVEDGATVDCGAMVAIIAEPGEDLAQLKARYGDGAAPSAGKPQPASPAPSAQPATREAASASKPAGRRPVSPVARKLAAEAGIDIDKVQGTGPGGRVTREDVERAVREGTAASAPSAGASAATSPASSPATPAAAQPSAAAERRTIPFRGMRKTIAERMHQSLSDCAQLTITTEADVTAAAELRERLSRDFNFTYTDMLVQAVARALLRHPQMNARLEGAEIVLAGEVNVGMAVALEQGLIVPVIRNAAHLSLRDIAASTRELGEKARSGGLKLEDVSGGTFTITNLGTYGVDAFTPILNLGETGILGVGRIVEKPAVHRGEITRRSMMTLSLTFDHRIIDGAPAAAFLRTVVEIFNYGER